MKSIFDNPSEIEVRAKNTFSIPPFLMMENAAHALADFVKKLNPEGKKKVHILCGKGNNGADGLALARLLQSYCEIIIYCPQEPKTEEGKTQYQIAGSLGLLIKNNYEDFFTLKSDIDSDNIIVDCIYGIGFHGDLEPFLKDFFSKINSQGFIKLACDVPSGLGFQDSFNADYTITMGQLKTKLFTDNAKAKCGKIIVADLGISRKKLESCGEAKACLIEESDIKLPFRKNKSSHKGTYGHAIIFAGEKSGAGIISATAAMKFGCGLTSIYKTKNSNLEQFKISPELMICENIPERASAIAIGSGLGNISDNILNPFIEWFESSKNPACVIDADLFSYPNLKILLDRINKINNARIILTPHLKELFSLLKALNFNEEYIQGNPSDLNRMEIGKAFTRAYPNCTLIMKSAVTYIADKEKIYICNDGVQSLAKGGSGDILAGMAVSLLAQGYSSLDAAITAVETHALAAKSQGPDSFTLTPESLINQLSKF
ncbi:MAG: NAD(P)H-hydrate dehydratase [Treponema sp.]|nr:NAD(P)H-hydrate dehydratase [Treponema sp.]